MKKFIMLSALVAATSTAFVACSSDDDLAQQPKAPETTVEEGTPLVVKVLDATRGTDWTNGAGANPLDKFTLFATANGSTTRWSGALGDRTNPTPATPTNSRGTLFENDGSGNFAPTSTINWQDGRWDFYALSDATFSEEYINPSKPTDGVQDAEHLDAASRSFSYTVLTNYNAQTDLLVAEAIDKQKSGGNVDLQFYHGLAQIGQITLNFANLGQDNTAFFFIIKSITIHGLKGTGTYTFPASWSSTTYNDGTWAPLDGSEPVEGYHIELPQFELDGNNNYKIFEETVDPSDPTDPFSNTATGFAAGTKRGKITGLPNYFQGPDQYTDPTPTSYVLPLAKKTGTEGAQQTTPYTLTDATYTTTDTYPAYDVDGGLYIIPQPLAKTAWTTNSSGQVTGVTSGVYAEIRGIMINVAVPDDFDTLDETIVGSDASWKWHFNNVNNAEATQILNHDDYIGSYYVPLVSDKKELKAGKRYNLTFELSQAVTIETGKPVFDGATIE